MDIKINKTEKGTKKYSHHCHKQYELMHYVSGEGEMWTEKGSIPFSEGTVIIMPPNIMHGSVSNNDFVNISVECDFDGLLLFDAPVAIEGANLDEGAVLATLIYESRYKNESYLHSLCIAYAQYLLGRVKIEKQISSVVQNVVRRIVEDAFLPQIDMAEILRQSGYAEDYIRMCFRKTLGKTPGSFLTDIRIRQACYLINVYRDALSLSEIAERCGYTDYVYFSKKFKSVMGMSPKLYREQ